MKKLLIFLISVIAFGQTSHGQFVWSGQNSGFTTVAIKDVWFKDVNNGWGVCELGYIIRTTDGGNTWTTLSSPVTVTLHSVSFSSPTTGWIVGDNETLLKSTDGGSTWFIASPPSGSSSHLYDIQFTDANHGWILGFWDCFRTTDGGNTWINFDPSGGTTMYDLHFINNNEGWVCGPAGALFSTVDGGITWSPVTALWSSDIYAIHAISTSEIVIAGSGGYIHKTYDGGNTWVISNSSASSAFLDIDFLNPLIGVAVGNSGIVFVTSDGGESWSQQVFATCDLTSVDLVSNGIGWVSGYCGSIYKSNYADSDLIIYAYQGVDTLCENVPADVVLTLHNQGDGPIEEADIAIIDVSTPILYYHWSGLLLPGSYQDVNVGTVILDHSGYYTGAISGDSITTNNISNKYIEVLSNTPVTSNSHTICQGDSVLISAYGGDSYTWFGIGGDSTAQSQYVQPDISQEYEVQIKHGICATYGVVQVLVESCDEIVTAFSPNGDGSNDFLKIEGIDNTDNTVKIYNRWGDEVNSFTNYDNVNTIWDGRDRNGNDLIEGTYYYSFETSDQSVRQSSWIQLVR